MEACMLCPRKCGAARSIQRGVCGADDQVRVAKIMLHQWEEPFISGTRGSGTVFFSGCNLGCVYCQNHEIRDGGIGEVYDVAALADAYLKLQQDGAHNINLVTAAPYVPDVAESLRLAKALGLTIPVVYNSSGYECVEAIHSLEGLVDIYLPDYKYITPLLAQKFSTAPDYAAIASPAITEMFRQVGDLVLDETGVAKRGLVIRHLILPGCVDDSRKVLDEIVRILPLTTHISLMSQYTPQVYTTEFPLNRKITQREYDRVISYALSLGLHNILLQTRDSAKSIFTPQFTEQI
ncbi:MAG: radical SAM protein [Firmicutes bacterium HGW-Firmicutes-9]|jgi:putative pyruvate formate lyase activating enzyme|nr:MAG: radical SAM protein [Firmicutes bacterium HGW-Firmicutes-9]